MTTKERLLKMGIEKLNDMQEATISSISKHNNIRLLSPTGSGKTLAFLLSALKRLDPQVKGAQLLILTPSRELTIQINQVFTDLQKDFLTALCYGGVSLQQEKGKLQNDPAVIIGTPGRILDHLERKNLHLSKVRGIILDEYDKSLEFGFQREIRKILGFMNSIHYRILTSATQAIDIPEFLPAEEFFHLNFLSDQKPNFESKLSIVDASEKLEALVDLLSVYPGKKSIIFFNHREAVERASKTLNKKGIYHDIFHGGMEQVDRERSMLKYRQGSILTLLCTDLAARGLDIPEIDLVIHYQVPRKEADFTHRNGRTARMQATGEISVLLSNGEFIPEYIVEIPKWEIPTGNPLPPKPSFTSVFVSGGKKDKISKIDLLATFCQKGGLEKNEIGNIHVEKNYSLLAVSRQKAQMVVEKLNNKTIKKRKVRVAIAK